MDFTSALGAEIRGYEDRQRDGQPTRVVIASRTFDTEPSDLWQALTDPERIPRWLLPISGDLKLGGRYQLKGHAGGAITRCDPPEALDVTWEVADNTSWVAVRLAPDASGTKLTLEHTMPTDEKSEEHWQKYGPGATGVGWELMLAGLGLHLAYDGAMVDQTEAHAWMASDNGKTFMRASAKAWADAYIAAGAPPETAHAMTERIDKFYTGG